METNKKEAIVVIAIGEKYKKMYDATFRESHERFAKKIGVPLIIIDDFIDKSERSLNRSPAWQSMCIFEAKETKEYNRLFFIDADVYITHNARNPFKNIPIGTVGIVDDNPYNLEEKNILNPTLYKYCPLENRPDKMINGGIFVADRNIHTKTLSYIYNNYEEQVCYHNGPMSYHILTENKVTLLSSHFNTIIPNVIKKYGPLWFFTIYTAGFIHFCGEIHEEMVAIVKDIDLHPIEGTFRTVIKKIYGFFGKFRRLVQRKSKKLAQKIILILSHLTKINLVLLAYRDMGILNHKGYGISGEEFLVTDCLHKLIEKVEPIFFDIGANTGKYSSLLRLSFPSAKIFAFEPNKASFKTLEIIAKKENYEAFHLGLSSSKKETEIFFDTEDPSTELASLYSEVMENIHENIKVSKTTVLLTTLNDFCKTHNIFHIDFLKIDTEGHEFEVLCGSNELLNSGNIDVIQFEFNEMNIISRAFLKDFYTLLPNYHFYRLDQQKLIDIGKYETRNEIFQFQNIIAISKKMYQQTASVFVNLIK